MSRRGKIARLPQQVREQLNCRLDDNEEGPQLLDWLNNLPQVKEIVNTHFGGVPISKQNLYQWRQGGYREWAIRQELHERAYELSDNVRELEESVDPPLMAGDLAAVLAARYAAVFATWDNEPGKKIEAQLRMLRSLCHDIAVLQRTMHRATVQKNEFNQQLEEARQRTINKAKDKALAPIWAALHEGTLAKLFGGGEAGEKIAKVITAVQYDLPIPDFVKQTEPSAGQTEPSNPVTPSNT